MGLTLMETGRAAAGSLEQLCPLPSDSTSREGEARPVLHYTNPRWRPCYIFSIKSSGLAPGGEGDGLLQARELAAMKKASKLWPELTPEDNDSEMIVPDIHTALYSLYRICTCAISSQPCGSGETGMLYPF